MASLVSFSHGFNSTERPARRAAAPLPPVSLGPTRTYAVRTATLTPASPAAPAHHLGTVTISLKRFPNGSAAAETYRVTRLPLSGADWPGKGFRFTTPGGLESRCVFLARDRRRSLCDCEGFTYESTRRADRRDRSLARPGSGASLGCKHLDCAHALDARGLLAHPLDRPAGSSPLAFACDLCEGSGFLCDGEGGLSACPECHPAHA